MSYGHLNGTHPSPKITGHAKTVGHPVLLLLFVFHVFIGLIETRWIYLLTNQNFRCVTPSSVVAQINLFKVVLKSLKLLVRDCDSSTRFSTVCPSDPGFYQACGHSGCTGSRELAGTPLLCETGSCDEYTAIGFTYDFRYRCKSDACGNTELNMVGCDDNSVTTKCNNICDKPSTCSDESDCNGVQYGMWCVGKYFPPAWTYIPPWQICTRYPRCINGEDTVGCNNWITQNHRSRKDSGTPCTFIITNQNFRCVTPSSVVAQINLFKVVLKSLKLLVREQINPASLN
eukprot:sb/3467730/